MTYTEITNASFEICDSAFDRSALFIAHPPHRLDAIEILVMEPLNEVKQADQQVSESGVNNDAPGDIDVVGTASSSAVPELDDGEEDGSDGGWTHLMGPDLQIMVCFCCCRCLPREMKNYPAFISDLWGYVWPPYHADMQR
jgi:hypothetical protein